MAYFGDKTASLKELRDAGDDLNFPALPAFGTVDAIHLPAIQVEHAGGDQNLELQVTDYSKTERRRRHRPHLHDAGPPAARHGEALL